MIRRTLLKAVAMTWIPGSLPRQRPDQALQGLSRSGSGPAPPSPFVVARRVVVEGPNDGIFVYNGTPAAGNLIASISAVATHDPFGNAVLIGDASYNPGSGTASAVVGGTFLAYTGPVGGAGPWSQQFSIITTPTGTRTALQASSLLDLVAPQTLVANSGGVGALTSALLEVHGDAQFGFGVSVGQGAGVQTLITGSTINTAAITMQPVTCAAAVTGIILQAGTFDGQQIVIPSNAGVGFTITFAASGTSNVSRGTATTIQPGGCCVLFWVASLSLWFPVPA